jgi:hypothetical protein
MYPNTFESDVMDDLYYESEGQSDMGYGDEYDQYDQYDEYDGFDAEDEYEDEFDQAEDPFDEYDELGMDHYSNMDLLDAMEEIVADALSAEDTDEFFGKLWRGIKKFGKGALKVAKKVGRGIGQAARVVGPIASMIPLPQAQAIGRVAGVVGKLMADGADEFEAIDELADFMDYDDIDAAAPVIAGLTIRSTMPNISKFPLPQRRKLLKTVSRATKRLMQQQGVGSAKIMPKVVQVAKKSARQMGLPLSKAIARTTAKVAQNPMTTRRLLGRRSPMGKGGPCPTCGKNYTLRGPVTISIRGR